MNKSDLVNEIAGKTTLTRAQIKQVVEETFAYISETLVKGEKFQIVGFGSFTLKRRALRDGVNPRTGEKIRIESKLTPVFIPGKKLSEAVNKPKK